MNKFVTSTILLGVLSLIALAVVGCGAKSETAIKARVAEAANNSQTYLASSVQSFRSRVSTVQTLHMTDGRDLRNKTDQEWHLNVTFDFQTPDRLRTVWEQYTIYPDEPGKRYWNPPCAGVGISIGTASYGQACDGTWSEGSPIDQPMTMKPYDAKVFQALTALDTVSRAPSETLRGVAVDVYKGSYVDKDQKRDVVVKIGKDNGLVMYFQATAPGFFWEIEQWDFNSPDVVVEAPLPK